MSDDDDFLNVNKYSSPSQKITIDDDYKGEKEVVSKVDLLKNNEEESYFDIQKEEVIKIEQSSRITKGGVYASFLYFANTLMLNSTHENTNS